MADNLPAAQALPLPPADLAAATRVETILSRGLWKLLSTGDDWSSAVRLININPTLRAELENVAVEVVRRSRAADPVDLMALLLEKKALYGLGDVSKAEATAIFNAYLDALAHQPLEAVREAFKRWDLGQMYPTEPKRHAFYPKPAELNVLAEDTRLLLAKAAYRAKKAFEAEAIAPPKAQRMTKAEMIAAGFMDADGKIILPKKDAPKPHYAPRGESPQQMAERLRAQTAPPASDGPEEAF